MSKITHTGFQSPAGDYEEDDIRIDQYLLRNPYATFVMRMQGDAMKKVGLFHNDLLLVDKSLPPKNNSIVVAWSNKHEFIVRRLLISDTGMYLLSEQGHIIGKKNDFTIWGVVTFSIRHHHWKK